MLLQLLLLLLQSPLVTSCDKVKSSSATGLSLLIPTEDITGAIAGGVGGMAVQSPGGSSTASSRDASNRDASSRAASSRDASSRAASSQDPNGTNGP